MILQCKINLQKGLIRFTILHGSMAFTTDASCCGLPEHNGSMAISLFKASMQLSHCLPPGFSCSSWIHQWKATSYKHPWICSLILKISYISYIACSLFCSYHSKFFKQRDFNWQMRRSLPGTFRNCNKATDWVEYYKLFKMLQMWLQNTTTKIKFDLNHRPLIYWIAYTIIEWKTSLIEHKL